MGDRRSRTCSSSIRRSDIWFLANCGRMIARECSLEGLEEVLHRFKDEPVSRSAPSLSVQSEDAVTNQRSETASSDLSNREASDELEESDKKQGPDVVW